MEKNDDFALKYFKYQQSAGLTFWICLILIFVFQFIYGEESLLAKAFFRYSFGFGPIIIFFVAYAIFVYGFSLIDQVVRDNRTNFFSKIAFNVGLLSLLTWPYVLLALIAFSTDQNYLIRLIVLWVIYLIFYFFSPDFWRILFRARPIEDNDLSARLDEIGQQADLRPVKPYVFSTSGLKYANAFSVGNVAGKKGIFFSTYAYQNLTQDEVRAIYAHEIGHFGKNQNVRRSLGLVIPVLLVPLLRLIVPGTEPIWSWGAFLLGVILMKVMVPSQRFEKEADLFAVKATGDVELCIASLQRIYELGLLPKRFRPSDEKKYTHPSLQRRIKYMRQAAGTTGFKLETAVGLSAREKVARIIFGLQEFTIQYQNGQSEVFAYSEIVAMFPEGLKSGSRLTIRRRDRTKLQKILLDADYNQLAGTIDLVEAAFAEPPGVDPVQFKRSYYVWGILMVVLGAPFALFVGVAQLILGIIGLAQQNKMILLAYSVISAMTFIAVLVGPETSHLTKVPWLIVFGGCAVLLLIDYLRFRKIEEKIQRRGRVSFSFGLAMVIIEIVVLAMLISSNVTYIDSFLYVQLTGLPILSLGILCLSKPDTVKRRLLMLLNALVFLLFLGWGKGL